MAQAWKDNRPMSPHLQVWKWHPTMMSSILHRAGAIMSYVALALVAVGLLVLALTGSLPLEGLIFGPLGAVGLAVFLFGFIFMALAQLRHAIWNRGVLFEPQLNNAISLGMIALAVLLALGITAGVVL